MPAERPRKTSRAIVSEYDLCNIHVPSVLDDGTTSYVPRSTPAKAEILRRWLLTGASQGKERSGRTNKSGLSVPSPPPPAPKRPEQTRSPQPGSPQPESPDRTSKVQASMRRRGGRERPSPEKPAEKLTTERVQRQEGNENRKEEDVGLTVTRRLIEAKGFHHQRVPIVPIVIGGYKCENAYTYRGYPCSKPQYSTVITAYFR